MHIDIGKGDHIQIGQAPEGGIWLRVCVKGKLTTCWLTIAQAAHVMRDLTTAICRHRKES